MIDKVWETGSMAEKDTLMTYNIHIQWNEQGKEYTETFSGTDVNDVLQRAIKFIITHYKPNQ